MDSLMDILRNFTVSVTVGLITVLLGMITGFLSRRLAEEKTHSVEEAQAIASAASAQAEAAKARALELLAEKLPATSDSQELLKALDELAYRLSFPASDRKEEHHAWGMVEDLIRGYHKQALEQARIQFWFSVVAATVGFVWIIYSATKVDVAQLSTILNILPGATIDAVALLFFRQASETRQRATALYDRLRSDNERSQAIRLVESIDDVQVRSAVKAQIALHMAGLQPTPIELADFLLQRVSRRDAQNTN